MATITEIIRGWNLNKQMGAQLSRVRTHQFARMSPHKPSQSATAVGHSRPGQASKLELDPEPTERK